MRNMIEEKIIDRSDECRFSFEIKCEICSRVYKTLPLPYNPHSEHGAQNGWVIAHKLAYVQAVREFTDNLSFCPECGRFICDNCFLICHAADICMDCAERLGMSGIFVKTL